MKRVKLHSPLYYYVLWTFLVGIISACMYVLFTVSVALGIVFFVILLFTILLGLHLCFISVSFDDQQIYFRRFFWWNTVHIPWRDVRIIHPLTYRQAPGINCVIETDKKKYSIPYEQRGIHRLLAYWEVLHQPAAVHVDKELLPSGCYHIPLHKRFHFYLGIGAMLFLLFVVPIVSTYPFFLAMLPIALIMMWIIILIGPNLYTYELTPTHFCLHHPFFLKPVAFRWEEIGCIMNYSAKMNFLIICTKEYSYHTYRVGYFLSKEWLENMKKAGIVVL